MSSQWGSVLTTSKPATGQYPYGAMDFTGGSYMIRSYIAEGDIRFCGRIKDRPVPG